MKKEEPNPIDFELKILSKKFKCLSRDGIRIIHQFCEYDYKRTHRVMSMMEEMKNPASFIQTLIKKPERAQQMINDLEYRFIKRYGQAVEEKLEQKAEQDTKEQIPMLGYNFFEQVQNDTIQKIMFFLDPYSLVSFSLIGKAFYELSQSEAQSQYYKLLCKKLYSLDKPRLPGICRFEAIRDYVLQRPLQYRPNTRNAVLNNLRRYIWKVDLNSFTLEASYYKQFGSYLQMFRRCPKVNLNGFYVLRDKYIRVGQKNEKNPITPIHVIYYYRYLRFFEDGSVLYHVRNKKLKENQMMQFLSGEWLGQKELKETMVGEFIQYKDRVLIKAVQSREVFAYELQLRSTNNMINNELKVHKYTLELIDDHQDILQTLYQSHPNKEDHCFSYFRNQDIQKENSPVVQATSL